MSTNTPQKSKNSKPIELLLTPQQKSQLEQIAGQAGEILRRRANLLLLYHAGNITREVAPQVGLSLGRTRHWRRQFFLREMEIFIPRKPGTPPSIPDSQATTPVVEIPFPPRLSQPGILPDDTLAEAGRKIMIFQFAEMLSHEGGTRQGQDPEELHDMRVATRRLRAAFTVFGEAFSPKALKPHLKGLRRAGQVLGAVRDLDVALETLNHYLDGLAPDNHPGLLPLVQAWGVERASAQSTLLTHLDSEKYHGFKREFNRFVQSPGTGTRSSPAGTRSPHRVRNIIPALVYTRMEAVRAFESILPSATIAQLHALRIEFKRLRYTLEFFREVLGEQVHDILDELKDLQDHLGELHDADVDCQTTRQFLKTLETQQAETLLAERHNPEPIVGYLAYRSAERHQLMITFPPLWEHFNRPELRLNLALAIAVL
jgi:CHAD domain-containing protein